MIVNLIAAIDQQTYGIGYKGEIPWKNANDMRWFRKMTTNYACIMGWNTFVSLKTPLRNRLNIVLSKDSDATTYFTHSDNIDVRNARTIDEALKIAEGELYEIVFVIGGASIYRQFLENDLIDSMYIDYINNSDLDLEFDTYFPFDAIESRNRGWDVSVLETSEDRKNTMIAHHRMCNPDNTVDHQYISLLRDIKERGRIKQTRAGETLSVFGRQLRFSAMNGVLPIITTKKMYIRGCVVELLWFINGGTNIKYLIENKCNIWNDDAYRYYLENVHRYNAENVVSKLECTKEEFIRRVLSEEHEDFGWMDYQYGYLGPIYGKQWNNWSGINQLNQLIDTLKTNPDDRRLMISSWNVGELNKMALPPCHYTVQWYTTRLSDAERAEYKSVTGKECPEYGLSVMWSQRSVDTCLGLPYNILSYSIFLYLIAQCVGMVPYEVICNLGDTHIYKNQLDGVVEQLSRNPYRFAQPTIEINEKISDIHEFTTRDVKVVGYESYPTIKYPLSVG